MKHGIIRAISKCRLKDALKMLEECRPSKPVIASHKLILTAMMDSDSAYTHALEAKILIQQFSSNEFQKHVIGE